MFMFMKMFMYMFMLCMSIFRDLESFWSRTKVSGLER